MLQLAADDGRVLVSGDVSTIQRHFAAFTETRPSPGIILIPPETTVGEAIQRLLLVWRSWTTEEIENQIWWL